MGNRVLMAAAASVADPTAPDVAQLIADMTETMAAAGGVGLAAPQVAAPLRLVLFRVPAGRTEDGAEMPLTVLINPEIVPLDEAIETAYEGCLSLPGLVGAVPRHGHIGYSGLDVAGRIVEREARGFHARVVQHECDHLDGVLYPMRMTDMATLACVEEIQRRADEEGDA